MSLTEIRSGYSIAQTVAQSSFKSSSPIGLILDGFTKSIEELFDKLANKVDLVARDIILNAAKEIILVIESLKGAYQESLDKTYEKVDQLMRDSIDRVQELMDDIIEREEKALLEISDRIEDTVAVLPFSNWWIPLLRETQPHFFAVDGSPNDATRHFSTQVTVVFRGRFPYADRYKPTLTVNHKEYQPTNNSNKELQFRIAVASDDPKIQMHKYSYLSGILRMDWKSGWWPWSWTTSEYNLSLGILPATPGKISAIFTKAESQFPKRAYYPYDGTYEEVSHYHGDKYKVRQVAVRPHPEWHIVKGSSHFEWKTSKGRGIHKAELIRDEPDQVTWEYTLGKDFVGTFQIDFKEYQTVPESKRSQEIDKLRWGSSDVFSPELGERITLITFEAFNGESFKFPVPLNKPVNTFIELHEVPNGSIQIQAKKASVIDSASIESLTKTTHQQKKVDVRRSEIVPRAIMPCIQNEEQS